MFSEARVARIDQKILTNPPKNMGAVRFIEAALLTAGIAFGNGSPIELSHPKSNSKGLELASVYQPPFGTPIECRAGIDCIDPTKTPAQVVAVVIDGKPFGYPPECRNAAPCDPEQDPLAPSQTPSDQLPQGSQPA